MTKILIEIGVGLASIALLVLLGYTAPWYATALATLLVVFGWVFYIVVLPRILEARSELAVPQVSDALKQDGKVASSWWHWLYGFKTQLCLIGAAAVQAIPQLIDKLMGVDLSAAFGPKIGGLASISLIVLGSFFHAQGLVSASKTTPASDKDA